MFKKATIVGLIVVLLAGVFGVATGPPIREEVRMQQYHAWALKFEETWECMDVIGIAENQAGFLEIYLRGDAGACTRKAGTAFYETEIFYLEELAERFGYPVEFVIVVYAFTSFPEHLASEHVVTKMDTNEYRVYPGVLKVPEYLKLWEGRGE